LIVAIVISTIAIGIIMWRQKDLERVAVESFEQIRNLRSNKTVQERLEQYGHAARDRFLPFFEEAGVKYPPAGLNFVGFKDEKILEVYADDGSSGLRFIRAYPILAASGVLGPKLGQGDRQVPEGIYQIEYFNPNSSYHLSIKIDYPNKFDLEMAERDGRTNLGGDIMIHGRSASIGCLAMGDEAIEEIFTMAAETGRTHIRVILSPVDFRKGITPDEVELPGSTPSWTHNLYEKIAEVLDEIPQPTS